MKEYKKAKIEIVELKQNVVLASVTSSVTSLVTETPAPESATRR